MLMQGSEWKQKDVVGYGYKNECKLIFKNWFESRRKTLSYS